MTRAQELMSQLVIRLRLLDEATDVLHQQLRWFDADLNIQIRRAMEADGVNPETARLHVERFRLVRNDAGSSFGKATAEMDSMSDFVRAMIAEIEAAARARTRLIGRRSI